MVFPYKVWLKNRAHVQKQHTCHVPSTPSRKRSSQVTIVCSSTMSFDVQKFKSDIFSLRTKELMCCLNYVFCCL
uniref:Uncharacterized protein n=1 Tax=Rhizophora mucronata TaxID=61149 RepID=A0A2P2JCK2_RHIMU